MSGQDEYTPSVDEVREAYGDARCIDADAFAHAHGCPKDAEFDRMMAAHDAELLARVRDGIEALDRLHRWIDDSELVDLPDVLDVLDRLGEQG